MLGGANLRTKNYENQDGDQLGLQGCTSYLASVKAWTILNQLDHLRNYLRDRGHIHQSIHLMSLTDYIAASHPDLLYKIYETHIYFILINERMDIIINIIVNRQFSWK